MARVGPDRQVQQDFSAGMFRSVAPELIPRNGLYDVTNGLLEEDGSIYRRGGSEHLTLLEGDPSSGMDTGVSRPNADVSAGSWVALPGGGSLFTVLADDDGSTYVAGAASVGNAFTVELEDVSYGVGEGLASLTVTYEQYPGSPVVQELAILDGSNTVLVSTTGSSVAYVPTVALAAASANALRVRVTVMTDWGGGFAVANTIKAAWVKGDTTLPALPEVDLDADITFLWSGWIGDDHRVLFATTDDFWVVNPDNYVAANLDGAGLANPGRAAVMDGTVYFPGGSTYAGGGSLGTAAKVAPFYAVVANRLIAGDGDTVYFSNIDTPGTFDATDYHKLPGGVRITGIEGLRDSAVVFTTGGIWVIGNMALNLTDDAGNVQQRLDHYSTDLVLWGDAGIAGWAGALVVPARDGVWLLSLGVASEAITAFERISGPIDDLYRRYVAQGCQPGCATVHRGHYFLPILSGLTVVDVLVCRIDQPVLAAGAKTFPWTHLDGYGGRVSGLTTLQSASRRLIGAGTRRLMDLHYFEPSLATAADADGTAHAWDVTTRDYGTGSLTPNTVLEVEARYQLQEAEDGDDPTIQAFVGTGRDPGQVLTDQLDGDAPVDVDAVEPFSWPVRRKATHVRFRLVCEDPAAVLSLRSLDLRVRSSGRVL